MREELTNEEIELLKLVISNHEKYQVNVDNDDVFVVDLESDEIVGDFHLYGYELAFALFKYMGANTTWV